ncbi:MAG: hypothetical protein NT069_16875 [Planctomycetota bacterium]|nr:hypothetical protein [Planctomycetota bacterium]
MPVVTINGKNLFPTVAALVELQQLNGMRPGVGGNGFETGRSPLHGTPRPLFSFGTLQGSPFA